jgi:hypothetical protein
MAMTFPTLSSGLQPGRFELHFPPLHHEGWDVSVPCDAAGHVDLDALDERVRNDYFFARALLGREFALPRVETSRMR